MKKLSFATVIILITGLFIIVSSMFFWNNSSTAPSNDETVQDFLITKGSSAEKIANDLKDQGLIKNPLAFKFYVQLTGKAKKIPPGEFRIASNLNLEDVIDVLLKGPVEIWVTIPEGLRREEIVERFVENLNLVGIEASEFRSNFLIQTQGLEGFLYPDTYLFPLDVSAEKVVMKLQSTFDLKFDSEMKNDLVKTGLNLNEAVTLASIIERETLTADERPIVAGIYFNRLNNDWPLQADATVQYALGASSNWWPKNLTRVDLEINSPYNTYKYMGLPDAPIANPGIVSLKSVVYSEDTDYMYYIHDPEGQIHYAETLSQHNANVARYLK